MAFEEGFRFGVTADFERLTMSDKFHQSAAH
jgi:hypothetical protein